MHAIRHYLLVLAGLVLLAFLIGLTPMLWVASTLVVAIGVKGLTVFTRSASSALTFTILGLVLLLSGAVLLYFTQGWKATLGFVVLVFVYYGTSDNLYQRSHRHVVSLRKSLCELVQAQASGQITEDQLTARAEALLRRDLHREDVGLDSLISALIKPDDLPAPQHQRLLELLQRYLAERERLEVLKSPLHQAVIGQLGLG
jgi:hypothetical protein